MAINYKVVKKSNPQKPADKEKYYLQAVPAAVAICGKELSDAVAESSLLNTGDAEYAVKKVLEAASNLLLKGHRVQLGEMGYLWPSIQSKGASSPEEVNVHCIKCLKINFRASLTFRDKMRKARYNRLDLEEETNCALKPPEPEG